MSTETILQQLKEHIKKLSFDDKTSFQCSLHSIIGDLEMEIITKELELIAYMQPNIDTLKISSNYSYDDEGSYDT